MEPLLRRAVAAAVFDMDGVIADTRELHLRAWTLLFDDELPRISPDQPPFTALDYDRHVDGRSREDGIRTVLGARHAIAAAHDAALVARLAARKQQLFEKLLGTHGAPLNPGADSLIRACRGAGVRIAVATASKNAQRVLGASGLLPLFDAVVDGTDAETMHLGSKPDPALFVEACHRLGVAPSSALLVEDSEAGVAAAAAAGFALVVGIAADARRAAALRRADADVVVSGLAALSVTAPGVLSVSDAAPETWVLGFDGYDPAAEGTRESLCALANGYWGTRGAAEEASADDHHYPGTYLAGVYDAVDDGATAGEEMVNIPNWLPLMLRPADGDWFAVDDADLLDFRQDLDLRQGVLRRRLSFRDDAGRETTVRFRRIVSIADPRLGALQVTIRAANWEGALTIRAGIDTRVRNTSTDTATPETDPRGRVHLVTRACRAPSADTILVETETIASAVRVAVAERTRVYSDEEPVLTDPAFISDDGAAFHEFTVHLRAGHRIVVEKTAGVSTSRDRAIRSPSAAALAAVEHAARFEDLLADHARAWERLWSTFAVSTTPTGGHSVALNLNTFHVLQTLAGADGDLDAGVPARGLHGEAYGGHVFWDELFVYPLFTLRRPEVTRSLLAYRHRRLPAARAAAAESGRAGALFPWQSATTGTDVTPDVLLNPLTGRWMRDNSHLQRHVGLGIAYCAWQFYQTTGDAEYLAEEGGALIIEVARYFASMAEWDDRTDRYSIRGVMGPDEFHDGLPDSPGTGLTDNVYTNVMTAWVLLRAADTVRLLSARPDPSASEALGVSDAEREQWARIAKRLTIVFNADGTLSQFAGYDALAPLDLEPYRQGYPSIGRLDLILDSEGGSTNTYQVSKQPDSLMLLYLFSAEELRELFKHMGYTLDADAIVRTVERYSRTSTYGSTLSNVVHSWLEARRDRRRSWQFLERTLQSDLGDIQGGTTRHGIHLAAMAGSVDLLTRCYSGLETRADMLWFHPQLPDELGSLAYVMIYRSHRLDVAITHESLRITSAEGHADPIRIMVEGQPALLHTGETCTFEL